MATDKARSLARYFLFAYAISWLVWAPAVLARFGWAPILPARYLHLAGGMGPMIASIALTARSGGVAGLVRLGGSCIQGGAWLAIGAMIPAVLFVCSIALVALASGEVPDWSSIGRNPELPELSPLWAALASVVCYGFGEELGWRGFALPRLQATHSALHASLLLTLAWAGWHLPLFFFADGLSALGIAGAAGWLVSLALGSILLAWLFNSSGGSVGAVALLHAMLDIFTTSRVFAGHLLPNVMGATLTVGTLLLVPRFGPQHLARRPRVIELQV